MHFKKIEIDLDLCCHWLEQWKRLYLDDHKRALCHQRRRNKKKCMPN